MVLDESGLIDESGLEVGKPRHDDATDTTTYTVRGFGDEVEFTIAPWPGGVAGYDVAVDQFRHVLEQPLSRFQLAYAAGLQLCRFALVVKRARAMTEQQIESETVPESDAAPEVPADSPLGR